ncbi:MAG: DUF2283 domain-containing protein [Patescibacteria group bacterium]|nr:DUF2283 domain-containing protein [Patescibacteria group bacterium]
MPKIYYDKEAKIMTIKISNKKSVDSDAQKNIVMDYDKNGDVTKIEMMSIDLNEFEKEKSYFKNFLVTGKAR